MAKKVRGARLGRARSSVRVALSVEQINHEHPKCHVALGVMCGDKRASGETCSALEEHGDSRPWVDIDSIWV